MTQLFINTDLDEDVDVLVARLVRARHLKATTTAEDKRLHSPDPDQLEFAAHRGMAMLTHNREDFELLAREHALAGRSHAGRFIAI